MAINNKITFMGFLLAVSTVTVSAATASPKKPMDYNLSNKIEYRLSRITKAIENREIETINSSTTKQENLLARGFANRSGGGGFANSGGGGFANRSGGGGFVNRSPFRNGGGFYNRY
ncbi:GrrA/OscA1 family cyclophane-containing rSAM-modified RiPP [Crocosphaera sp.]|uniref:GrrA/OscA1 family cyclophane-containing rSAM-modified RiPP n=1 Tax=Crocosphaera sp. TaxID=2729996 RepID=UPI0026390563|nr:GrrA/OscA1 family cyclophane-containing rSAM-modified RiPP [Crocosphaera sp.]MDJ0580630.1 GrrA/OscA1 family cyclophane-containing rSAM-modified RiPP [Crocosphaera sp.]